MGAITKRLFQNGKDEQAEEYNDILVADLASADSEDRRIIALDTLGNVGIEENNTEILKYIDLQHSPRIVASAINALRNTQSSQTEQVIVKHTGTKEVLIQKQAIQTLKNYDLKEEHLNKVLENVKNGNMMANNYLDAVALVTKYKNSEKDACLEILEEIQKRNMESDSFNSFLQPSLKNKSWKYD